MWELAGDGTAVRQGAYNGAADASWKLAETFDFNGDGVSDLLWRKPDGGVAVWQGGEGGSPYYSTYSRSVAVPTSRRIAGAADFFYSDGKDDLIWQNSDGSLSIWAASANLYDPSNYHYGPGFLEAIWTHKSAGASWLVEGTGDFNGDGQADILWRNTDGGVSVWAGNGSTAHFVEGAYFQGGVPTSWHIDGVGDFDGDGKDDLLWRNDNGAVSVWRSNGPGFDPGVYNAMVPTSWHIAQVGDFNADGRADIVWQNDNGAISTWQSNGVAFDQAVYTSSAPPGWTIDAHQFVL